MTVVGVTTYYRYRARCVPLQGVYSGRPPTPLTDADWGRVDVGVSTASARSDPDHYPAGVASDPDRFSGVETVSRSSYIVLVGVQTRARR